MYVVHIGFVSREGGDDDFERLLCHWRWELGATGVVELG